MNKRAMKEKSLQPSSDDISIGELQPGVQVYAASIQTARQLLITEDDFLRQQSRFDRQARLNLRFDVVEVTKEIYLDYVCSQVMPWSKVEITELKKIISSLNLRFSHCNLGLPKIVYLVKTTGQEEGNAAYTRGMDTICLPTNMVTSLSMPTDSKGLLDFEDLLNHECFHLFSKNNPERRYQLYKAINYYPTGNDVELPDVPCGSGSNAWTLPQLKITNPDAALSNVYIEMEVPLMPGKNVGKKIRRALLPVLFARCPYDRGGKFFEYLMWQFLAIEQDMSGQWVAMNHDGAPLLYDSKPLLKQYMTLVGANIEDEIFHPDEILAQNFVLASKEPPTPDLLSTIQRLMA